MIEQFLTNIDPTLQEKAGINYEDKRLEHSLTSSGLTDDTCDASEKTSADEGFSDSMEWWKYNDVVGAAQDSFESAALAEHWDQGTMIPMINVT